MAWILCMNVRDSETAWAPCKYPEDTDFNPATFGSKAATQLQQRLP